MARYIVMYKDEDMSFNRTYTRVIRVDSRHGDPSYLDIDEVERQVQAGRIRWTPRIEPSPVTILYVALVTLNEDGVSDGGYPLYDIFEESEVTVTTTRRAVLT